MGLSQISKKPGLSQISTKMATGSRDLAKFQKNLDLAKFQRKWQQVQGKAPNEKKRRAAVNELCSSTAARLSRLSRGRLV
jgi:hypothetical protein